MKGTSMIRLGSLCMVVRTAWPDLMGRVCTCVSNTPHPFGSHRFKFPDGSLAYGEAYNVRVISDGDVETQRPREEAAA